MVINNLISILSLSGLDFAVVAAASLLSFAVTYLYFRKKSKDRMNGFLMNALVQEQDQYIAFLDLDYRIVLANKSFEDLIGVSSDHMIGKQLDELDISNEMYEALIRNNDRISKGKPVSLSYNASFSLKGQRSWFQFQKRSLILKSPDTTYILIVASDISDKKNVEEQLNVTQNEYKQLVESAQDIIFRTNLEGDFEYVNLVVEKILGYTEKEFLGMNLEDVILAEDHDNVKAFYDDILDGKNKEGYLEFRAVTKSGNVKWMGQTVSSIKKIGVIIGFQSVTRDITTTKEAEAHLKKAKELAEEASNSKSNFISSMSHEFRTPLNAILGYAQILEKNDDLSDTDKHHVAEMAAGGEQLLGMIKDILELSTLDSDYKKPGKDSIEVTTFFREISMKYAELADNNGIAFEVNTKSEGAVFNSDSEKISSIVSNLLDNAVKFSTEGIISFTYNISSENEQDYLNFTVQDEGIGIAEPDQDKIFEPFWQYDNIKYKGTGLGLTLCRRLTEYLGGTLQLESELGKGTTIQVKIPVQGVEKAKLVPFTPRRSKQPNKQHEGVRVLIVDDLVTNRTITRIILEQNGFTYKEAENGEEAIMCLETFQPDVILMDINMPVMDGIEATQHIRNLDSERARVPVIAVTAGGFLAEKNELLDNGFTDYILKPFRESDLIHSIQKSLNISKEIRQLKANTKKIGHKEVAGYIKKMNPTYAAKIHSILKMQDMESIAAITDLLDQNGHKENPYLMRLENSAKDYDYLFITRVFKDLADSKEFTKVI